MSLATRCPACGTIFRVVQDQLKVSEGWVRCGQCHEVFHGIEALFDLESDPAFAARRAARQVQSDRAAFASAPTMQVPLTPTPAAATASALAPAPAPIVPTAPMSGTPPVPPRADQRGADSGFASDHPAAAAPLSRAATPRFDALRAEAAHGRTSAFGAFPGASPADSPARVQASSQVAAAAMPSASEFTFEPPEGGSSDEAATTQAVPPTVTAGPAIEAALEAPGALARHLPSHAAAIGGSEAAHAEASSIASTPDEPPRTLDAPTVPMGLDPLDREHVDITLADDHRPLSELLPETRELDEEEAAAIARVSEFLEDTHVPVPSVPAGAPAEAKREDEFEDDEDDDEADAGPPTLASMLPDAVATWPPRRRRMRRPSPEASKPERALESDHPRFVREARRDERWNRPAVRAGLAVALVVLVGAAAAQLAWPWRDTIASRWPATAPALEMACDALDCRIEAPRSIASLTLDGSSLTRTDEEHVLLFSADLRNRSDHAARMPSFDLSFTDLNGQVVARKVLAPSQIGIRLDALGPEAELHVHARIQVAGLEASGFQAEMFYP